MGHLGLTSLSVNYYFLPLLGFFFFSGHGDKDSPWTVIE